MFQNNQQKVKNVYFGIISLFVSDEEMNIFNFLSLILIPGE